MKDRKLITPKDRLYLSDLLSLTLVNAKKARMYFEMATDEDVKNRIKDIESTFVDSYDELLDILEEK